MFRRLLRKALARKATNVANRVYSLRVDQVMKVRVSGKQVEIGAALPEDVRTRLEAAVSKHFDGGADANVIFSHDGPFYRTDCTVHLDSGVVMKAEGDGKDAYLAFDASLEHLEKQLRRYKRKLKNHHEKSRAPKGQSA